ncbi:MAG: hypothetical protein GF344_09250 [Chitinivibrionales bacterium]|nr:hypothetical protein [Chitinivibrionales bacterium]MBD3357037.1 hypothetical protein [Chitinivibrionales bacterium]
MRKTAQELARPDVSVTLPYCDAFHGRISVHPFCILGAAVQNLAKRRDTGAARKEGSGDRGSFLGVRRISKATTFHSSGDAGIVKTI